MKRVLYSAKSSSLVDNEYGKNFSPVKGLVVAPTKVKGKKTIRSKNL